ncbi:hypothetical protein NDU88_002065 [Pleurodeles waltl]|uniref:Uncharacterized protein n=1 Tax=Pleurodeles waltl TaxID=8319 RepID=A0AAV7KSI2_PLEWA|nr:hypothetical protein NDU88_002065 [Pleurodeles waltl]
MLTGRGGDSAAGGGAPQPPRVRGGLQRGAAGPAELASCLSHTPRPMSDSRGWGAVRRPGYQLRCGMAPALPVTQPHRRASEVAMHGGEQPP